MRILLFGSLGEEAGRDVAAEISPEGCSVAELRAALVDRDPACAALAKTSIRAAVDQIVVGEDHRVLPGQEVAFFPPLSGG